MRRRRWHALGVLLFAMMCSVLTAMGVEAATYIPDEATEFNGNCYCVFNDGATWTQAKKLCQSMGGHLVTFSSKEENELAFQLVQEAGSDCAWIGLYNAGSSEAPRWKWVTGEALAYINWQEGQPDYSYGGEEKYGGFWGTSGWNDYTNDDYVVGGYYVCEWENAKAPKQVKKIKAIINDKKKTYTVKYSNRYFDAQGSSQYARAEVSAVAAATTYAPSNQAVTFLNNCGFTGSKKIFSGQYSLNPGEKCKSHSTGKCNHHCTIYTGKKSIGGGKTLIALVINGYTTGKNEWISNFEIGQNSGYHEGFYTAAQEVMNMLRLRYGSVLDTYNVKFWITGHSRGAAITNLVAEELSSNYGPENVFAYGFATPNVADIIYTNPQYKNIVNVVNNGDFVPFVPPASWDYRKNGRTITFDVNEEIRTLYKKYRGVKYTGTKASQRKKLINQFVKVGKSKGSYYAKNIGDKYSPAQYCQKGLAVLVRGGKGDVLKGGTFMIKLGILSKRVADLNKLLIRQEAGEVIDATSTDALLAAHKMETYLAYVHTNAFQKKISK